MKFRNWVKNKLNREENYHEVFLEAPKEEKEDISIKAKRELYKELQNIGVFPKIKYAIGHVQVDFGFPNEKLAVEVISKNAEGGDLALKKKYSTIKAFGWKVYGFSAENVFLNAKETALKVKKIVSYHKRGV